MKTALFALLFMFLALAGVVNAQTTEVGAYSGIGYMTDPGGGGYYQYTQAGLNFVKGNHLIGGFVQLVRVDVSFNDYRYQSWEKMVGISYFNWGELSQNYTYTVGANGSLKRFDDQGKASGSSLEEKQSDYGFYGYVIANLDNKNNSLFSSYKFSLFYQTAFWSERVGIIDGNITDKSNFKAVNRMYVKTLVESSVKKFPLGATARIEPKVVGGYLYDGGSQKGYFEFGAGFAISVVKGSRYYEPFNFQYRARYDKTFIGRLDLFELNSDLISVYKLLFQ
jgi:hypothetical protein